MTDIKIIETKFTEHCLQNAKDFERISISADKINAKLSLIKDNHLFHIKEDVDTLKANMAWVKKIQWALISGVFTNLIGIIYLIINKII